MIRNFRSRETGAVFSGESSRKFRAIEKAAKKRLLWLHAATSLKDLANTYSNHLEALGGDRKGQYSIRINDRWRICFVWKSGDARDVEIVAYH